MYWADNLREEIIKKKKEELKKKSHLIIRDEKTVSGSSHLGSLRGVAIHGIIYQLLKEGGISVKYLFEINDFDVFDSVPHYLDQENFAPHLGKLLLDVPSPDDTAKNYAEYFGNEFKTAIQKTGFDPEYYYSSALYKEGKFNEAIREALDKSELIKKIYKKVSGSVKEDWYPLNVFCESCGKVSTTKVTSWDGEAVQYVCGNFVDWASGCGHDGKISPFNGNGKLPWKVEWAAKFKILDVDIEGGGKDHSTKGGSRDVANNISREVFGFEPPFDIPYEFFQSGGKKMSSSKGIGSSAKEVAGLLPTEILRLLLLQKEPQKVIEFDILGDTVPVLFDTYDFLAKNYFSGKKDDYSRIFELIHPEGQRKEIKENFLPRFSLVSFLAQMPHMDLMLEMEKLKGEKLTENDREEIEKRKNCSELWIKLYAPEKHKFILQEKFPENAQKLTSIQKEALKNVLEFVEKSDNLDGQAFHSKLHEIKEDLSIEPKDLFSALYLVFLGKSNGPKAGWFLGTLDKEFLVRRLKEAIK